MRRRQALAIAAALALAAGLAVGAREHGSSAQAAPAQRPERPRSRNGRPDTRRDGRPAERQAPDRRSGGHVRQQLRLVFAVLSVSRNVLDRPVLAQQRRSRQRATTGWLPGAGQVEHVGRLATARRLLHRPPRQVPQRLRPTEPDGDPGGLERMARGGRSDDVPLLQLHAQRGRDAPHVLCDTATVLLPDRRLPGQGERDHPAPRGAGALLPVGRVPRQPFRRAS